MRTLAAQSLTMVGNTSGKGIIFPSSGNGSVHSLLRWPQASSLVLSHPTVKVQPSGFTLSPFPCTTMGKRRWMSPGSANTLRVKVVSVVTDLTGCYFKFTLNLCKLLFHPNLAIHIESFICLKSYSGFLVIFSRKKCQTNYSTILSITKILSILFCHMSSFLKYNFVFT